jgi:hypothetical protein
MNLWQKLNLSQSWSWISWASRTVSNRSLLFKIAQCEVFYCSSTHRWRHGDGWLFFSFLCIMLCMNYFFLLLKENSYLEKKIKRKLTMNLTCFWTRRVGRARTSRGRDPAKFSVVWGCWTELHMGNVRFEIAQGKNLFSFWPWRVSPLKSQNSGRVSRHYNSIKSQFAFYYIFFICCS